MTISRALLTVLLGGLSRRQRPDGGERCRRGASVFADRVARRIIGHEGLAPRPEQASRAGADLPELRRSPRILCRATGQSRS